MIWILIGLFSLLAIEQLWQGNYAKAMYWASSVTLVLSVHWMK